MNVNESTISEARYEDETARSGDDPPRTIAKDTAFHLLQNGRRRAVLRMLIASGGEAVSMREVAEHVAAWENDTTVPRLSSMERQRVYIALYQSHLPKLDDHGVIEYDQDRGTLRPMPLITVFEPYLDCGLDVPNVLHSDSNDTP